MARPRGRTYQTPCKPRVERTAPLRSSPKFPTHSVAMATQLSCRQFTQILAIQMKKSQQVLLHNFCRDRLAIHLEKLSQPLPHHSLDMINLRSHRSLGLVLVHLNQSRSILLVLFPFPFKTGRTAHSKCSPYSSQRAMIGLESEVAQDSHRYKTGARLKTSTVITKALMPRASPPQIVQHYHLVEVCLT